MSARPTGRRQALRGPLTDYLTDLQGSVRNLVGTLKSVTQSVASYFYCPAGNSADGPFGTAAAGNPFQYDSAYYDSSFQSYWMDGL